MIEFEPLRYRLTHHYVDYESSIRSPVRTFVFRVVRMPLEDQIYTETHSKLFREAWLYLGVRFR